MSDLRTAAQQALEALLTYEQYIQPLTDVFGGPRVPEEGSASAKVDAAITALRESLAEEALQRLTDVQQEMEQEPVAWAVYDIKHGGSKTLHWPEQHSPNGDPSQFKAVPLYAAPPQRKPLDENQMNEAYIYIWRNLPSDFGHTASEWVDVGVRYAERVHGITGEKHGS